MRYAKVLKIFFSSYLLLLVLSVFGNERKELGKLGLDRSSYNVTHYNIRLKLIPDSQSIAGSNAIRIRMMNDANRLRLDFVGTMRIDSLWMNGREVAVIRNGNMLFLHVDNALKKDSFYTIQIHFSGKPIVAIKPPWKGGFVWSKDFENRNWIGLACEGIGASAWLPCKDHWSDEADSMDMELIVPKGMCGVSNGKLQSVIENADSGYTGFKWKVRNPINNYNISVNAGYYSEMQDTFMGIQNSPLTYYVLDYNAVKAETHFLQVHTMLEAFEHYFGPYPFYEDSYKLVETPYWGMEHQSCIAYGNNYQNNAFGFDFIIIHESGHEWFANSITASDHADMWIHESFTTYSEALYLEYTQNKTVAVEYLLEQKKKIVSKHPMQGPRGVYFNRTTDSDIYYKGTWMLHTMRSILNNDSLWFACLLGLNTTFYHSIIRTEDVVQYFNAHTNYNWDVFYKQYLYSAKLPVLKVVETKLKDGRIKYTLYFKSCVKGFSLPLQIGNARFDIGSRKQEIVLHADFDLYAYLRKYFLLETN